MFGGSILYCTFSIGIICLRGYISISVLNCTSIVLLKFIAFAFAFACCSSVAVTKLLLVYYIFTLGHSQELGYFWKMPYLATLYDHAAEHELHLWPDEPVAVDETIHSAMQRTPPLLLPQRRG
jgi:hypothetical protein